MIGLLTGNILNSGLNPIIIDVSGVGYQVNIPSTLLSKLHNNTSYTLFIHTHVKEDSLELYGFYKKNDLNLFNILLSVSGIGPKTALLVIDKGAQNIIKAIDLSDVDFFMTVPRLGKKNAQKIIIELKNKIGSSTELDLSNQDSETKDILEALSTMGFDKNEILNAVKKLTPNQITLEDKIRYLLKQLKK